MKPRSRTRTSIRGPGRSAFLCIAAWRRTFNCSSSNVCRSPKNCFMDASESNRNGGRVKYRFSIALVIAIATLSISFVAAQAPKRPAKPVVPKTPWGDPDLQGVWNDATSTPLQRPNGKGETVGEGDASQFEEQLASDLNRDRRDGGP